MTFESALQDEMYGAHVLCVAAIGRSVAECDQEALQRALDSRLIQLDAMSRPSLTDDGKRAMFRVCWALQKFEDELGRLKNAADAAEKKEGE